MSQPNPSEWMDSYRLLKTEVIAKRQEGRQVPSSQLKQFASSCQALEKDLKTMQATPMEYLISSSELARRQVVVDNLKRQISMLSVSGSPLQTVNVGGARIDMDGTTSRNSTSSVKSNSSSSIASSSSTVTSPMGGNVTTSNKGLVQRQQEIIKMQDEIVLDIGKGVDRLHQQAKTIGEEAKTHLHIIGKLDEHVDQATEGLKQEAQHADEINRKTAMCSYYVCVTIEVVVIVLLLILWLGVGGVGTK